MEDNFNSSASLDDVDQDRDWKEILQNLDDHTLSANAPVDRHELSTARSHLQILTSHGMAMESLNPVFYTTSLTSPSSILGLSPSSTGFNPSLISINQQIPATSQPLMSLEASLHDAIDADKLVDTPRQQLDELSSNYLRSSWYPTFLQSLNPAGGVGASSSSSYNNLLSLGEDPQTQGLAGSTAQLLPQFDISLQQQAGSGIDELILEQMSNDFINYGAGGSLQEQLSNALSATTGGLMMGNTSMSTAMGRGVAAAHDESMAAQANMLLSTPASSVSSDGGPDDDSSSHEDMSINTFEQFDDFMMQSASAGPINSQPQAVCGKPLPSSDATSSRVSPKADNSAAPSSNDQEQSKKRGSKAARVTKKPKRERGAKLAIKIPSDVDVLDDGYKWRKYGQKPVKNSPYPRSYYKCTDKQCKVKKHVERQAQEPEFVVTTYEGVHNHCRPDQQVQALHSQSDVAGSQPHDSFQPFVPAPSMHSLSAMEFLGLYPGSLDSQPLNLPLQQPATDSKESVEQGILQNLLQGEPRTSPI